MRLLSLELENWRSHGLLELDLDGIDAAAIVGHNGAGKSSILLGIEYALYGGSHDELLARGADRGGVNLVLEQAGKVWKIGRGRERGKKSWCVVSEKSENGFKPLAMRTLAESQTFIEEAITGMDSDAFRATVYAPQGEVGVLASLGPGQRKALLGGLLGLDSYEEWREQAALDSRGAHSKAEIARERVEDLHRRAADVQTRFEDVGALESAQKQAEEDLAKREAELEKAIARQADVEKVRRRLQLVAEMKTVKVAAAEAKQRAEDRAAAEKQVKELAPAVDRLAELEEARGAHQQSLGRRSGLEREVTVQANALIQADEEIESLRGFIEAVDTKLEETKAPGAKCPTCGQEIEGTHRDQAIADLEGERERHVAKSAAAETARAEVAERHQEAEKALAGAEVDSFDEEGYQTVRDQVSERERAIARLDALSAGATVEDLKERWATLKAEAESLPKEVPEGPTPESCREGIAVIRQTLSSTEERLRTDAQARKEAKELDDELKTLTGEAEESEVDERAYAVLAKAFSRDGIPAMILDNAVGGIEAATNDTLEALGVEMSIRLVTQRATKSGTLAETLDILVDDGTTEAPLESFSGGEQARVHIALRLGLAQVLSAGTGLELGFLLIDEVPDVDTAGVELLAQLVADLPQQVLLVSHNPELTETLPQRITVERSAGSNSAVTLQ